MRSLLITLALAAAGSVASAQLINPSFDTGDLTGWTASNDGVRIFSDGDEAITGISPFSGVIMVPGSSLMQTTSVYLRVGEKVGVWMNGSENGSGLGSLDLVPTVGSAVHVYWSPVYQPGGINPVKWNELSYRIQQDGFYSIGVTNLEWADYPQPSFLGVDNFSITPVPEASTYGILAVGLGIAAIARRRRSAALAT